MTCSRKGVWSLCVSEPFKRHGWGGFFWKRKEKKQCSTELRVPVCCLVLCVLAPWCWLDTLRSIIQRLIPPWCPQCTQSYTLRLLQPTTCHNTQPNPVNKIYNILYTRTILICSFSRCLNCVNIKLFPVEKVSFIWKIGKVKLYKNAIICKCNKNKTLNALFCR